MATALKNRKKKEPKKPAAARVPDAGPPVVEGEEPRSPVTAVTKRHESERSSNVSDETIREFCNKAAVAFGEFEKSNTETKRLQGIYREVLKSAKKQGVDQTAITWWLQNKKREPDEIDRETRNRNRVAKLMGMPIGTQLGLFEDAPPAGTTVATAVDQQQLTKQPTPYEIGYRQGIEGKAFAAGDLEGEAQAQALDGWQAAQAKLATSLGTSP